MSRDYSTITSLPDWPNEADEMYADRVLSARYYRGIKRRADDYVKELRAGEHADLESFEDRLREDIDSDADVIYTARARTVGYVSRFDWQQEWEDMGCETAPTAEQIAYLCILGDVREEIGELLGESVSDFFDNRDDSF